MAPDTRRHLNDIPIVRPPEGLAGDMMHTDSRGPVKERKESGKIITGALAGICHADCHFPLGQDWTRPVAVIDVDIIKHGIGIPAQFGSEIAQIIVQICVCDLRKLRRQIHGCRFGRRRQGRRKGQHNGLSGRSRPGLLRFLRLLFRFRFRFLRLFLFADWKGRLRR